MSIKKIVAPREGEVERWREKVCQIINLFTGAFETDTTAASSGDDGTISSRSATALGECDGFIKTYKTDGTAIYIPYWEDITPS